MIHVHNLDGCSPMPLAHYLKALGILRLVSEQIDGDARGWWHGDHFRLATHLTRDDLEQFFLREYQPTPLVSPWNKGAGFFLPNDRGLSPLEHSSSPRFKKFRDGIRESRKQLRDITEVDQRIRSIKAETKVRGMSTSEKRRIRSSADYKQRLKGAEKEFARLKKELLPNLRLAWRGPHREWLDSAVTLTSSDEPKYPALLGTGGNDGRLDFTNHFMQMLGKIFDLKSDKGLPQKMARTWLAGALWGVPIPKILIGQPVGQYLPGTAGGANNSNGPSSESLANPLDFVLMLEGSVTFTLHTTRRFGSYGASLMAAPFAVKTRSSAYASASSEEGSVRGEQWMPLWSQPSTYREVRRLLTEGRAQIGIRTVREPLDFAKAVRRLGTAQGVRAFQRYGYLERNGQSTLAVPLGMFETAIDERSKYLACLDDLDSWQRLLQKAARDENAPIRLKIEEKRLADSLFSVTKHQTSEYWQRVLLQVARVEDIMVHGSGFSAQPLRYIRREWIDVSNDNTAEFRLALVFALQGGLQGKDRIRRHWLPLKQKHPQVTGGTEREPKFSTTGTGPSLKLDIRPEVVMNGRRGIDDAISVVERRTMEAASQRGRYIQLAPAPGADADMSDIARLLSGRVDLDRTLELARPFMCLKYNAAQGITVSAGAEQQWPDDAWLAIRLCTLPWKLTLPNGFKLDIGTDPALVRRLAAGDASTAISIALRRLGAAGVRCVIRTSTVDANTSKLWAAALAFPISKKTAIKTLYRIDPSMGSDSR